MPYGETEDRAKQSTPLLLGGYEKEYKGRKVNMDGMDPEECSPQQHSVCQLFMCMLIEAKGNKEIFTMNKSKNGSAVGFILNFLYKMHL